MNPESLIEEGLALSVVHEDVQKGAAWLDEHGPEGWWRRIDLARLDLRSTSQCVLGQVFSDCVSRAWSSGYGYAGYRLGAVPNRPLGIFASNEFLEDWKALISERLAEDRASVEATYEAVDA